MNQTSYDTPNSLSHTLATPIPNLESRRNGWKGVVRKRNCQPAYEKRSFHHHPPNQLISFPRMDELVMHLSCCHTLWTYQRASFLLWQRCWSFPGVKSIVQKRWKAPSRMIWKGPQRLEVRASWLASSLPHSQCSEEALVGLPNHSQVNFTWGQHSDAHYAKRNDGQSMLTEKPQQSREICNTSR